MLTWLMNLDNGELRVHDVPPGAGAAAASVRGKELAEALVGDAGRDPGPVRFVESLPVASGEMHDFLVVGFPIGGLAHRHLGGAALDITRHQHGVDRLAQQALLDELTGLYNLRGFLLFAEHELKIARRRGTRCALLYVDVDDLKQINDRRGHQSGNAVLVTTANLLRRVFRECDVIARLHGDEFAVFAADVKGDPELLRTRLSRAMAQLGSAGEALSVSCGVGSASPDPSLQLSALLSAADQAMYQRKCEKAQRTNQAVAEGVR